MAMPDNDLDDRGFLTGAASNPWISVPYLLATGLGSAASPRIARGVSVANQGLGVGLGLEEQDRKQRENQRLSEALAPIFSATQDRPVKRTGLDPSTSTFDVTDEDTRSQVPFAQSANLPSYQTTGKAPTVAMPDNDDRGFLRRAASNPWISIPWAIASGVGAAAHPSIARGFAVGNQGLALGLDLEEQDYKRRENQRLSQALKPMYEATTERPVTKIGVDPSTADFQVSQPGSVLTPPSPLPTYRTTEKVPALSPMAREGLRALAAVNPQAAARLGIEYAMREPKKPSIFGSAETGYHGFDEGGQVTPLVPGVGRRPTTPPRPVFQTQGGEAVDSVFNPNTQQWETTRRPVTPAPEKPKSELDIQEQKGRINERAARVGRIQRLTNIASSPKATLGQLSASLNALVRERESIGYTEMPEDEKREVNDAIRAVRARLAQVGRGGAAGGAMDNLPDAKAHKGRKIRDTKTGDLYQSDGKTWVKTGAPSAVLEY